MPHVSCHDVPHLLELLAGINSLSFKLFIVRCLTTSTKKVTNTKKHTKQYMLRFYHSVKQKKFLLCVSVECGCSSLVVFRMPGTYLDWAAGLKSVSEDTFLEPQLHCICVLLTSQVLLLLQSFKCWVQCNARESLFIHAMIISSEQGEKENDYQLLVSVWIICELTYFTVSGGIVDKIIHTQSCVPS